MYYKNYYSDKINNLNHIMCECTVHVIFSGLRVNLTDGQTTVLTNIH